MSQELGGGFAGVGGSKNRRLDTVSSNSALPAPRPSLGYPHPPAWDPPAPLAEQEEEDTEDDAGDPDVDADDDACGGRLVTGLLLPAIARWAQGYGQGKGGSCGSLARSPCGHPGVWWRLLPQLYLPPCLHPLCPWEPSPTFFGSLYKLLSTNFVPNTGNNTLHH